jgi:Signal peptidase, peptidase S26
MRDGLERYLEDVICHANLAREDERAVESELREHLQTILAADQDVKTPHSNPKEIYAMLEQEFGKPGKIGSSIARAKGRLRTYLKKQRRRAPISIAVCLVLAFTVRWAIAEPFYSAGDGAYPLVPKGSHVLVYKLTQSYEPGDVVVFRAPDGTYYMGIVKAEKADGVVVSKHGRPDQTVPLDRMVGRVFLNTR